MKYKKNLYLIVLFIFLFSVFLTHKVFSQDRSGAWDREKFEQENKLWEKELNLWENKFETIFEKRDECLERREEELEEQMIEVDDFEDRRYCNEEGCFEEDMFGFIFEGTNGERFEIEKESTNADYYGPDGEFYESSNGGQVIIYKKGDEYWESTNFGQVLIYRDGKAREWESSNSGQGFTYKGPEGKWKSSNYGQVFEYKGENEEWEGSRYDDEDDIRDYYEDE
ncbi:MAG: hypothetical protein GF335_00165 [Candidatus Moranbacteria bacterium]|nr:hypothetical protein [Candidatus Moranbacteria bacterium]